jgi:hypothetical protein
MKILQLSVFLENKERRLAEIIGTLASAGINIRTISLADTKDFGVLRMITDAPEKAVEILKNKGVTVKTTDIIAAGVEDSPGGLYKVLKTFKDAGINIEYMYAMTGKNNGNAVMIFRVDDPDAAIKNIKGVKFLAADDIYRV